MNADRLALVQGMGVEARQEGSLLLWFGAERAVCDGCMSLCFPLKQGLGLG